MAFPEDFVSIKNPPSAIISNVIPLILLNDDPLGMGASTPAVKVTVSQDYNAYISGSFNGATLQFEWSLDNSTFVAFKNVFDDFDAEFSADGLVFIPRLCAGVFVRLTNTSGANSNALFAVIQ